MAWNALSALAGAALLSVACGGRYYHGSGHGRPISPPLFYVQANAAGSLPPGGIGFIVTANDRGAYRVVWTDDRGGPAHFHGSLFAPIGAIFEDVRQCTDPRCGRGAYITRPSIDRVDFDSTPGANIDGVDVTPSADPLIVDLLVDGRYGRFDIYFTDPTVGPAITGNVDPAGFIPR